MTHRLPFAAALLATTLLAAPAMADSDFPPAISVTGEATVSAAPDQAQLDAGVTTDAKTAREASDANNVTMGKVLAAQKVLIQMHSKVVMRVNNKKRMMAL